MKNLYTFIILMVCAINYLTAQVTITESGGWFEVAYAKWQPYEGADGYNVYVSGNGLSDQKIDDELIRYYGSHYRADALGLSAGKYTLEIVPVVGGTENTSMSAITSTIDVVAHVREGFAFDESNIPGAYKANGQLKDGAQVVYVDKSNAKTVSLDVVMDNKGGIETVIGIEAILTMRGKGFDRTPLSIRFIGKVSKEDVFTIKDNMYLNLRGTKSLLDAQEGDKGPGYNITYEGIGEDAVLYGFGFNLKRTAFIEIRNLAFMLWGGGSDGDAITMDGDNMYIWVHNNDIFYGETGGEADQVKGDGSIDMKYFSTFVTISFNHFWDSGKVMGCGGATGEDEQLHMSFHHNWFDHSDSRMPRLTYTNAHVYNNYFDGVDTYGVGTSRYSSAFVENNYFRGTYRPILIPGQGTDVWEGDAAGFTGSSFTSQNGGMNKAYNNYMSGGNADNELTYFNQNTTTVAGQIDAYEVTDPTTKVPSDVAAMVGAYTYNNFDTDANIMYAYSAESPENAKNTVVELSGRMNGGDLNWVFNNEFEDGNKAVIPGLKTALEEYQSKLLQDGDNSYLTASDNTIQQVVGGETIEDIIFSWGGDITDVAISTLPVGLTSTKNSNTNTLTIGGSPVVSGAFTVTSIGSATDITISCDVTVQTSGATVVASSNTIQEVTDIQNIDAIIFTWGGDATDLAYTALPTGLIATKNESQKTLTISGQAKNSGSFTVSTVGGSNTVSINANITVKTEQPKIQIALKKGWNMVGYPHKLEQSIDNALSSIWTEFELIKDFDGFYDKSSVDLSSLESLKWCKAYFVKVNSDCILIW